MLFDRDSLFQAVTDYYKNEGRSYIDSDELTKARDLFFHSPYKAQQIERSEFILSFFNKLAGVRCDFSSSYLKVGSLSDLKRTERLDLHYALRYFMPWKKGPFVLFDTVIESEWNSYLKWKRIKPHLGSLLGKNIADIGCHNGYFMFKMIPYHPKITIGFDPVLKLFYNFHFLQNFVHCRNIFFEPLGVECIKYFKSFFDKVLCLGLLYHRTDPIQTLRDIHRSLRKGGQIIVDSLGIDAEGSSCLFPQKKYAGAGGVWFVPTKECLVNWLKRAQFKKISCFFDEPLSINEQRSTLWAPIASLSHYLDSDNTSLTVEGYPAPKRFYLKAIK